MDAELDRLTALAAPRLRQLCGIGPEVAGALLAAVGDNPQRLRSEAAFSMLCGASPIPASSGKTVRHRLNRGGNRQANTALYRIVVSARVGTSRPATTWPGGPTKACPSERSSGAGSAMWPARSSPPYTHPRPRPTPLDHLQEHHGRSHRFEPCHAHPSFPQVSRLALTPCRRLGLRHDPAGPRWGRASLADRSITTPSSTDPPADYLASR